MKKFSLKMIAIVDSEYGLAKNGEIPWSFAEDRKFFRQKTKNGIVIMGRRTFESLGAPLKNRINYVISKTMPKDSQDIFVFDSIEKALEHVEQQKKIPEIWIIGGMELFNYVLERNLISEAYVTKVSKNFHADLFLKISLLDYFKKEIIKQEKNYSVIHLKNPTCT